MNINLFFATLFISLMLICPTGVSAGVIISNLQGNDATWSFINAPKGGNNRGGPWDGKAAGFTMPAGDDYTLTEIELRLHLFDLDSIPDIQIYSDTSNNPGFPLLTLVNPSFSLGTNTFIFTPPAPLLLARNRTYWIVATNDSTIADSYQWMASEPGVSPTGIAADAGYRFNFGASPPHSNSSFMNSYAVVASVVPEPSTLLLVGTGFVGVGLLRRRFKK